jgi:hypothetical protein
MPVSVKLPNEFQGIYKHLFKGNPEEGTMQLVIHELRRRLAEYRLMEKKLHNKYNSYFAPLFCNIYLFSTNSPFSLIYVNIKAG